MGLKWVRFFGRKGKSEEGGEERFFQGELSVAEEGKGSRNAWAVRQMGLQSSSFSMVGGLFGINIEKKEKRKKIVLFSLVRVKWGEKKGAF